MKDTLFVTYTQYCTVKVALCIWVILFWEAAGSCCAAPGDQILIVCIRLMTPTGYWPPEYTFLTVGETKGAPGRSPHRKALLNQEYFRGHTFLLDVVQNVHIFSLSARKTFTLEQRWFTYLLTHFLRLFSPYFKHSDNEEICNDRHKHHVHSQEPIPLSIWSPGHLSPRPDANRDVLDRGKCFKVHRRNTWRGPVWNLIHWKNSKPKPSAISQVAII